ncbi:hypothetical protein GCM10009836_28090 [Pseudonocardia ailaonensis]|uniref:Ferredoxin reductase n=1 Tax=Pseudonocardia ailaonensis TaxID=367279 RepID=A0ABN2N1S9_9PSEU
MDATPTEPGPDPLEISPTGVRTDDTEILPALVVRAIGHRGRPIPGRPFDESTGTVPNTAGRVAPDTYVVGWIKRGSTGGIGANRTDAAETVGSLIVDASTGALTPRRRKRILLRR